MKTLEQLQEEYENTLSESNRYKKLQQEQQQEGMRIQQEINAIKESEKANTYAQGDKVTFIDADGIEVYCRIIGVDNECYDLLLLEYYEEMQPYTMLGYKYRYIDSLFRATCNDYSFTVK